MSGSWSLGEVFVLRHAGFPFDWLEELGISGDARRELDALFDAERALEETAPPGEAEACRAAAAAQRTRAAAAYAVERTRLRGVLHARASDARIQEAVFLSSPDVFENVWSRYVTGGPVRDTSATRRNERLVYTYLQRFCAKNETTSFFGPMGYGEIDGDDDAIELLPALSSTRRSTFLAYWAVEALASAVAVEPELWPSLPVRVSPLFVVDGPRSEARCEAIEQVTALSADQLRVLEGVARSSCTREVAALLGETLGWVESVAMTLLVKGILLRRVWFPSDQSDSLGALRRGVAGLPACAARARWLHSLDRVEALRCAFETAPLAERRLLLPALETLFTELTGTAPRRAGGKLYTDRLVLNEEASSPFRIRVGRAAAARLSAALSPLLETCASHGDRIQDDCARRVASELGEDAPPMGFLRYASRLRAMPAARLEPAAAASAGASSGPRFALPDLCLGRGADGAIHPVLSSMHHHLLTDGWLFTFHADRDRAGQVARRWMDEHATLPLVELASGRHNKGYYSFPGKRAAHSPAELARRASDGPVLAASELRVTIEEGRPTLRDPAGARHHLYLPLADLTLHAPFVALSTPPVVFAPFRSGAAHTPRIDMGEATYQRERWEAAAAEWKDLGGFALFAAVQRSRLRLGFPRFVFARVEGERKPCLIDTDSPFAVELLKHLSRESESVTFEEMLPAPDQLWLRDEGGRYTFELRIQAQRSA